MHWTLEVFGWIVLFLVLCKGCCISNPIKKRRTLSVSFLLDSLLNRNIYYSKLLLFSYASFDIRKIFSALSPYKSNIFSAGPELPNSSFTPIRTTGTGHSSHTAAQTASPRPPNHTVLLCCNNQSCFFCRLKTKFLSKGLIVWIFNTRAEIPCISKAFAASKALETHQTCGNDR